MSRALVFFAALLLASACRDFDALSRCFDGGCGPRADPCWKTASRDYRLEVLADAPSAYFRLGEQRLPDAGRNDGGFVAVDEVGAFRATYSARGVAWGAAGAVAADLDTAITVDGGAGFGVRVEPGLQFPDYAPFTVEAWVRQTGQRNYGFLVDNEDWPNGRGGWLLFAGGDTQGVGFERRGSDGLVGVRGPRLPFDGRFHALVATYDGERLLLYVDGALVSGATANGPVTANTGPWFIGSCWASCGANGTFGDVDEVAVYRHALEGCRISAHDAAARGEPGEP